jgi:hypothetical protein
MRICGYGTICRSHLVLAPSLLQCIRKRYPNQWHLGIVWRPANPPSLFEREAWGGCLTIGTGVSRSLCGFLDPSEPSPCIHREIPEIPSLRISFASASGHSHTWRASSSSEHLGESSVSRSCQVTSHFPTPHIPLVSLAIQRRRAILSRFIAASQASQLNRMLRSCPMRSFSSQCMAISVW